MTFEEAASLPHAAMLAKQGLIDDGRIQSGETVLINGAGGGVGTLGIQIARLYDVHVTGVDSREKLDLLTSLGYDRVLDYRETDFTAEDRRYDLILDVKTNRSIKKYVRSLKPGGRYISIFTKLKYLFLGLFEKGQSIDTADVRASTQTLCAVMTEEEFISGAYYADSVVKDESESAKNMDDDRKLYNYCNEVKKTSSSSI
ncbi:MAG: zinc-binding dehydrogenase, partial [Candidatus Marinimicrobia bacterium]|nr:zinc-binding dehydrogenase [Candidatus Neomarinimicrobiota bacterium]